MKYGVARILGVIALYLLIHLGISACSGSQQDEEGLEVSDQQESSETSDDQGNSESSDEEMSQDSESSDSESSDSESSDEETLENENLNETDSETADNETESDLQEIIQEMNSQQEVAGEGEATAPPEEMVEEMASEEPAPAMEAPAPAMMEAATSTTSVPFQPGGTPAGQGLPEIGSKMPYIVQAGDTLAKIAGRVYGDASRWKSMAELTGMPNPSRIYPGDVVYYTLDESSLAFATGYESVARGQEVVQEGDNLGKIASRVYGTAKNWKSIWRQNDQINDPDQLTVGMTVYYIQANALAQAVEKAKEQLATVRTVKDTSGDGVASDNVQQTAPLSDLEVGVKLVESEGAIELGFSG